MYYRNKKQPDAGILLNYDDGDEYNQGYALFVEALTKDDIFQPYMSDNDFRF